MQKVRIQNNSSSCCTDSERATVGVAVEPNAQCFADCCPVCPPEECCDQITIDYECLPPKSPPECTCPCEPKSFLDNIKFKTKDNSNLSAQTNHNLCVTFNFTHKVYKHDGTETTQNWTKGDITLSVGSWSYTFSIPRLGQTVTVMAPPGYWRVEASQNNKTQNWVYGDGTTCTGGGYYNEDTLDDINIETGDLNPPLWGSCGCVINIQTAGNQSQGRLCCSVDPYELVGDPPDWIVNCDLCQCCGGSVSSLWFPECGSVFDNARIRSTVNSQTCPTLTPTVTGTPYPTPTSTPRATPPPTPYPTVSTTPEPTPTDPYTPTPTQTPSPTPTPEPYYCAEKKEACDRGGCVGYYRPVACEPCIYTGAQGAPSGTEIDVYIEPNARYNCDRFEAYSPTSDDCQPDENGNPSPWLNDHKEVDEEGLCSFGGKIRACLPISNIDLRVWKIISGPHEDADACSSSGCCDYEEEPTPTPTETPTPTPTPTCPECVPATVTLTFDGCCLILEGGSIIAIGSGTVNASLSGGSGCEVKLNGNGSSITVEDEEVINVELTGAECNCCETKRTCSSGQSSFLKLKDNKIKLNKKTLLDVISFAYKKFKKKI